MSYTFKQRIIAARLKLAWLAMPSTGVAICANRHTLSYKAPKATITLEWKDTTKPDGISEEEMLRLMDAYAGRPITAAEISSIQTMRRKPS